MNDAEIVGLMRRGDVSGLEALLGQHGQAVMQALEREFGGYAVARGSHLFSEATSVAALNVFKNAGDIDASRSLRGWFFEVAEREMRRLLDTCDRWPSEPRRRRLTPARIQQALASMQPLERAILELDVGSGFSLSAAEVAKHVGVSVGAVYSLRNRAKRRLGLG